jgi:hypothetical protein
MLCRSGTEMRATGVVSAKPDDAGLDASDGMQQI